PELHCGSARCARSRPRAARTARLQALVQDRRMAMRIGISGWRYAPWRGVFYPEGLPQRCELEYAARRFGSVEINGSFYSLQSPRSWQSWRDATPDGFVFAVKGPRYLTHMRRLREFERPLANFLASGLLRLDRSEERRVGQEARCRGRRETGEKVRTEASSQGMRDRHRA